MTALNADFGLADIHIIASVAVTSADTDLAGVHIIQSAVAAPRRKNAHVLFGQA